VEAVRTPILRAAIIAAGLAILWLFAGRRISLALDRVATVPYKTLPASPIVYDGTSFHIGEMSLEDKPYDVHVQSGSLLSTGGRSFPLSPEPGDETSFTVRRSCLSWPTPFETNFMTGRVPSWKRHLYYRLVWKKRSGAKLEMVWRYEQWFYPTDGWTSGTMTHENSTGLIAVEIVGAHPRR
jgi:hypothetical protein